MSKVVVLPAWTLSHP